MEVIPDADLKNFLEKVGTGYAWLLELYELLSPEGDDNASNASNNDYRKTTAPLHPKIEPNIMIMKEYYRGEKSEFLFSQLCSDARPKYEQITFKRTFVFDRDLNAYTLKNKHRNGLGFHSLANELLSFLMLYNKKILTPQNIFESLKYQPCTNEKQLDTVCSNFWINFATSFLYVNFFNILLLLVCLDKMKGDYIEGKALRGVNPLIDIKTFIKTEELYHFLEIYDYYDNSGKDLITPEFFASVKDRLFEYMEIMGQIEQNLIPLMEMKINTSYVSFILCTSFFNEQFSVTSGVLAESTPSHIAGIKIIFDKYIEEIMGYAMDHFKDFSNLPQIQNSFFYHWRTLLSCAIKDQNHMINEFFDDKLHTRLTGVFNQLNATFQKFWESSKDPKERKKLEDKIKVTVNSCKHLGLLAINIPCNSQNRYTQIKLMTQIEEIQRDYVEFLKKIRHH